MHMSLLETIRNNPDRDKPIRDDPRLTCTPVFCRAGNRYMIRPSSSTSGSPPNLISAGSTKLSSGYGTYDSLLLNRGSGAGAGGSRNGAISSAVTTPPLQCIPPVMPSSAKSQVT